MHPRITDIQDLEVDKVSRITQESYTRRYVKKLSRCTRWRVADIPTLPEDIYEAGVLRRLIVAASVGRLVLASDL